MASRIEVAKALAAKHGCKYNRGTGPDIRTDKIIINVETTRSLPTACGRLRGFRGPVYVACTSAAAIEEARYWTDGKTVGIMNDKGRILKKSTRGRWP